MKDLMEGYREDLAAYQANTEAAKKLIAVGSTPPDESLDAAELAAWTVTANMLFTLDEVVNK